MQRVSPSFGVSVFALSWLLACGESDQPIELPTPMPLQSPIAYPVELWDLDVRGETIVMVHVRETGAVDSAYVAVSSGYAEFDSAAVRGALRMRFTPGRQGDRRVAMWTRLPVRFARDTLRHGDGS